MNPRSYVLQNRWMLLATVVALNVPPVRANQNQGVSTTEANCKRGVIYANEIKQIIEDCIAANGQRAAGQGYDSIVVISGGCYSGGLANLTTIGDDVIVAAAAAPDKIAHPKKRKMHFIDKLIQEMATTPTTAFTTIVQTAISKMCPKYVAADQPPNPPATSAGGENIVTGRPSSGGGGAQVQVVMFAGWVKDKTSRIASTNAHDKMRNTMVNKHTVPSGNIQEKVGGSKEDLTTMIQTAWTNMGDSSQFILYLTDHGTDCSDNKTGIDTVPDGNGGAQGAEGTVPTVSTMTDPHVTNPTVEVDTSFLTQNADVYLNSQFIGTLPASGVATRDWIEFPPLLLSQVGQDNVVFVETPDGTSAVQRVALTTGTVFGLDLEPWVLDDYAMFATCVGGPDAASSQSCLEAFDMGLDGDVDLEDFAVIQEMFRADHLEFGACCIGVGPDANCGFISQNDCSFLNGVFHGIGVSCAAAACDQ